MEQNKEQKIVKIPNTQLKEQLQKWQSAANPPKQIVSTTTK